MFWSQDTVSSKDCASTAEKLICCYSQNMHYGQVILITCNWSLEATSWVQGETSILLKIKWYLTMTGVLEARAANWFPELPGVVTLAPPSHNGNGLLACSFQCSSWECRKLQKPLCIYPVQPLQGPSIGWPPVEVW